MIHNFLQSKAVWEIFKILNLDGKIVYGLDPIKCSREESIKFLMEFPPRMSSKELWEFVIT